MYQERAEQIEKILTEHPEYQWLTCNELVNVLYMRYGIAHPQRVLEQGTAWVKEPLIANSGYKGRRMRLVTAEPAQLRAMRSDEAPLDFIKDTFATVPLLQKLPRVDIERVLIGCGMKNPAEALSAWESEQVEPAQEQKAAPAPASVVPEKVFLANLLQSYDDAEKLYAERDQLRKALAKQEADNDTLRGQLADAKNEVARYASQGFQTKVRRTSNIFAAGGLELLSMEMDKHPEIDPRDLTGKSITVIIQ